MKNAFNLAVRTFFLFVVLLSGNELRSEDIATGKIKFRSSSAFRTNSLWKMADSTFISYDSSVFKPLLFSDGLILYDSSNSNQFRLAGVHRLYAKVGSGDFQLLWFKKGNDTLTVNIQNLLDSGLVISNGANILLSGVPVTVSRIYFENPPSDPLSNNSYLSVNGILHLPETENKVSYSFNPGRVIIDDSSNRAASFTQILDTSFSLRRAGFRSNNLRFSYDENSEIFSLYGPVQFTVDSNNIPAVLGDSLHPGVVYTNGTLSYIRLVANDSFRLFKQKFQPRSLELTLDGADSSFRLFGDLDIETEGSRIKLMLGDSSEPGAFIRNDKLIHFQAAVADTFKIRNLSFDPENLQLNYDSNNNGRFYMFGDMKVLIKDDSLNRYDSISASFGNAEHPGFEIIDGELNELSAAISAEFKLKGMKLSPDTFGILYQREDQVFSIYGKTGISFDSGVYHVDAGTISDPGIMISNGRLVQFRASIDDTISLRGLKLKPQQLSFKYDSSSNSSFSIFGGLTAIIPADSGSKADTISCTLGNEQAPGLKISHGSLESVNLKLNGKAKLKGVEISTDSNGFAFVYDKANKQFEMYGELEANIDSIRFRAELGDEANPGIVISGERISKLRLTVSDTINIKRLKFKPDPLSFVYDSAGNNSFYMFGSALAFIKGDSAGTDTIRVIAGTETEPGLKIASGKLSSLNFDVDAAFSLKNLYIQPKNLTLKYEREGEMFEMFGDVRFALEKDTLNVQLGNDSFPGIKVANEKLLSLNLTLTDTIRIKSLKLLPHPLTFRYDTSGKNRFSMFGELTAFVESDTIRGKLGTALQPGFEFSNGKIQKLNIEVDDTKFELKKIGFKSKSLSFKYEQSESRYEIFGDVDIEFDSNHCAVGLGNDSLPGIAISNGEVEHINISLTDTFQLRGLVISPKELSFEYDKAEQVYEIFGSANILVKQDSIDLDLGSDTMPGLKISNGRLEDANIGLSTDFRIRTLELRPKNLHFFYSANKRNFGIYGAIDVSFEKNVIDMDMGDAGNPGLAFASNGDLQHLNLSTTDTFKLYSMVMRPQGLHFEFDRAKEHFEMFGSVMASLKSDSILLQMGDSASPGLLFKNNTLQQFDMAITDSMSLFGLSMHSKGLGCSYKASDNSYKIYGEMLMKFSGETLDARLGTRDFAGISIKNSEIESINIGVSDSFSFGIVKFAAKELTFRYDHDSAWYEMFGSLNFQLENQHVDANLGNEQLPGFIIKNGELREMNISVTGNLVMGGLQVTTKDLGMFYIKNNGTSKFFLHGGLSVNELWSISTTLGTPGNPESGLEIIEHNGTVKVDVTAFSIEGKNIGIGGITFNDLYVSYTKKDAGFEIDARVDVSFPPGFEIAGEIDFEVENSKFILKKIDLKYDAGTSEGLEIGETGIFITHMEGDVSLMAGSSKDYSFYGDIVVTAGGQFSFDGKAVSMLRIEGKVTVDKDHLNLSNEIDAAAYYDGSKWVGLYGSGIASFDVNWTTGVYKIDGDISYYDIVEFKADAYYHKNGTMGALGEVDLKVPDFIPIIGGKTLASIDGAVRYNKHDLNNSYAAGWTKVNLEVKKVTAGVEYNFGTSHIKAIGQKGVDNLEREVTSDAAAEYMHFTFNVPENVHTVSINLRPKNPQAYVILMTLLRANSMGIGPRCDLRLFTPQPGIFGSINISSILEQTFFYNGTGVYNGVYFGANVDSMTVNGFALHFQGTALDKGELLPAGQYTLTSSVSAGNSSLFTVEVQNHFLEPEGHVKGSYNNVTRMIDVNYDALLFVNDTATLSIYQSETPEYKGMVIGSTQLYSGQQYGKQPFAGKFSYKPPVDSIMIEYDSLRRPIKKLPSIKREKIYLYSVINDGSNSPVYTPIQNSIEIDPGFEMSLTPENVTVIQSGKKYNGRVDLGMNLQVEAQYKDQYKVSIFYDFDNSGYNGYPVENLQNLSIDEIINPDSTLSFYVNDLMTVGSSSTYYFYAVVSGNAPHAYQSGYSSPVSFHAPLIVNVRSKNLANPMGEIAAGMRVWVDNNKNGKYDAGVDAVHVTDYNGNCGFYGNNNDTLSFGILLDSITALSNPNLSMQTAVIKSGKLITLHFIINPKPFLFKATYSFSDRDKKLVSPSLYASFGNANNYFYADLNGNGIWDNSEPKAMLDQSENFSFYISQQSFTVYYVDALSKNPNISQQDKMRFRSEGQFIYKDRGLPVSGRGNEFGTQFDYRMTENSEINVVFEGIMKSF